MGCIGRFGLRLDISAKNMTFKGVAVDEMVGGAKVVTPGKVLPVRSRERVTTRDECNERYDSKLLDRGHASSDD